MPEVKLFTVLSSGFQFSPVLFVLSLIISLVENYNYEEDQMAPIILVHGISDSQIMGKYHTHGHPAGCEEKSDGPNGWEHLWMNFDIAVEGSHYLKCWAYRFKLLYDRPTHKCKNQIGVQTRVMGKLGSLKSCEYLTESPVSKLLPQSEYFHDMIEALENSGYSSDHSLKAHAYDWRYAPPQLAELGYFRRFTRLVEMVANDTKRKVAIVAHSMGGLVCAYFLRHKSQEWKDRHIHAFITSGTPWLGSTKTVGNYIVGNNQGIPTINKKVMKELIRTFQSIAFLLPQEHAFRDTVLVEWLPPNKKYTSRDYQQFFRDVGWDDGYLMRQDLRSLFPVPLNQLGVRYFCLWTNLSKIETPKTFRVTAPNLADADEYEITYTEGDGSVPMKSLRYCENFRGPNVTIQSYQGFEHTEFIQNSVFHDYVMSVVQHARRFS